MNGMMTTELCIALLFSFIIILIVITIFLSRKVKGGELSGGNVLQLLPFMDYTMRVHGWQTKVDPSKGKITVTKDSIVATDIFLIKQQDGRIEVFHCANAGMIGWILLILLIFAMALVGVILAILLHIWSRKFATENVIPVILFYSSGQPPYPQPYTPQLFPCSICGKPLRFVNEHQKWYCGTCRKYV